MRRKWERKPLPVVDASGSRNERRRKQWRRWTQIVEPKGRHAIHYAGCESWKLRVKVAVACANAALAVAPEHRLHESMIETGRIGKPNPGREVLIPCGRERPWNSGITGHHQSG